MQEITIEIRRMEIGVCFTFDCRMRVGDHVFCTYYNIPFADIKYHYEKYKLNFFLEGITVVLERLKEYVETGIWIPEQE